MGLAKRKDQGIIELIKTDLSKGRSTAGLFDAIIDLENTQFLPLLLKEQEKSEGDQQFSTYWQFCLDICIEYLLNIKNEKLLKNHSI